MRANVIGTDLEEAIKKIHPYLREAGGTKLSRVRLPNLIGVGTSRSGTSTLYGMLRASPEVYAAPMKEVNYFGVCDTVTGAGPMSLREYQLCFAAQGEERYVAEITPVYLSTLPALDGIREALGDVKIVVNLRDPVDRLVSHFKYHREYHGFQQLEHYLRTALTEHEDDRFANRWTKARQGILHSLYAPGLERILSLFPPEDVLVLRYDDLVRGDVWGPALTAFLGVEVTQEVDGRFRNESSSERVRPEGEPMERLAALVRADLDRVAALGIDVPESWYPSGT